MLSLYNLWRARIALSLVITAYGLAAAALGFARVWPFAMSVSLFVVCACCAALVFPWRRSERPEKPAGIR